MKTILTTDLLQQGNIFSALASTLQAKELIREEDEFFTLDFMNPVITVVDADTKIVYHFKFQRIEASSKVKVLEYRANGRFGSKILRLIK